MQVVDQETRLRFTSWGLCETDCGEGFAARTAQCANSQGLLVDAAACGTTDGTVP